VTARERGSREVGIEGLLRQDEICREIAAYLVHHNNAADTAAGIAVWWIGRDPKATLEALLKLRRHGIVRSHANGMTSVYAYTKNLRLRERVAQCIERLAARPAQEAR
jgi:hypothetical protein